MTGTQSRAEAIKDGIVIVGAGGFAREALGIFYDLSEDERVLGFVDDDPELAGQWLDDRLVLGDFRTLRQLGSEGVRYVIGVGHTPTRLAMARACDAAGLRAAAVISPHATVSRFACVESGAIICAASIVNTNARIGAHCIVNLACTIGHDAEIAPYSNLAPGVHVSGYVRVGEECDIGTGTAINQEIAIGEWSVVGAESVVVRDIPANVTAVGVPARPIKERLAGWHLRTAAEA